MIINEHNLIIGKRHIIISEKSISVYFYIERQINFILESFCNFVFKIIPVSTAPPSSI